MFSQCCKLGVLGFLFFSSWGWATNGPPLTVQDIMKFREIKKPTISKDGRWVTYLSTPDRGDGEAVAVRVRDGKTIRVARGSAIEVSKDGKWVAVLQKPTAVEMAKAGKDKKKKQKLKDALVLVEVKSEKRETVARVKGFAFSDGGQMLAIHLEHPEEGAGEEAKDKAKEKKKPKKKTGFPLELRDLKNASKTTIADVARFAFAPKKTILTWVVDRADGAGNGLHSLDFSQKDASHRSHLTAAYLKIPKMVFSEKGNHLALLASWPKQEEETEADAEDSETEAEESASEAESEEKDESKPPKTDPRNQIYLWSVDMDEARKLATSRANWYVAKDSGLTWSKDEERLFFGFRPDHKLDEPKKKPAPFSDDNFMDVTRILEDKGLDVWHGNDPFIKTYDKTNWKRASKSDFLAVYHLSQNAWVGIADPIVPSARATNHPAGMLLTSNLPYRRPSTWDGAKRDVWMADLQTGDKHKVAEALDTWTRSSISPSGKSAVFYQNGDYHLFNRATGETNNLTAHLGVPFANEDHDYPSSAPGYGIAGWLAGDQAVLIYDKYDIWVVSLGDNPTYQLTNGDGRIRKVQYRISQTKRDRLQFEAGEELLLSAYFDMEKHSGFYKATLGTAGVTKLIEDKKSFDFLAKAEDENRVLFTREDFKEFPDLMVAPLSFKKPKKLTQENPQIKDFAWGEPELVSWSSTDGRPLQGVLIKPGNYEPGKRYPVLVYYYRFYSQRMYQFNQMVINHRPNFPLYSSNGYAVFLPDIRFDVGLPGPAAVKCLVPGVQKLVDMGVADPDAIGLHGHSWSGYQTAFVITQTHIFKAAVAGAPVSNMTSAYSGIRLGSGLARQFQYEKGQSRIGGSMWTHRDLYIENSPVFYADRIKTPLLIQFGDIDEAVPWQQGIELYLAMRRLDKDVVFLQYRGEPHHLKQYPNKLDYTLKMKAYFDHYLKGEPAEKWISHGVAYEGK